MNQNKTIPDGQRTKVIYTFIKEGKYQDVYIPHNKGNWAPQL